MFKVGEYSEMEAKSIAGYLKDAGFKVDIKGLVEAKTEYSASLQGKLSEIKGKLSEIKGKTERYEQCERYLSALKTAMEKGASEETFRDLFLDEVIPGCKETLAKFEEYKGSPDDMDDETRDTFVKTMAECIVSMDFAQRVFALNDIEFGAPVNALLDDPIISVPVNPDDCDSDDPLLLQRMDTYLAKEYEITIDEFSASFFDEIDEDFQDEFTDEFLKIRALGYIIRSLVNDAEKGKMDIEEFADLCEVEIGDRMVMTVDGYLVAEEIARSLEKNGMLKMKGNTIKWKI